jgi:hypothetical protein
VSAAAPNDFAFAPATEQLAALQAKDVSSAELVELYLSRIAEHNPPLNAIVTIDADGARRAANQADAARSQGQSLGPVHGLPITVKDSYETAGIRTVCGRPDLANHVPTQDAEAVARLRRSGAIILGKTNMPTGNADVQASNLVFGRTNNPWDQSRTSGGASGGYRRPCPPLVDRHRPRPRRRDGPSFIPGASQPAALSGQCHHECRPGRRRDCPRARAQKQPRIRPARGRGGELGEGGAELARRMAVDEAIRGRGDSGPRARGRGIGKA